MKPLDMNLGSTVKVDDMTASHPHADPNTPNHHADHPGFSGISGRLAALSMRVGRRRDTDLVVRLSGMQPGDRVLDIGCGPGTAARHAARHEAIVIAVDPAEVMVDTARRADRGRSVDWRPGGAEALPVPDDSIDIAWSIASVHHWPDVEAGIAETARVLDAGGRFVAIERSTSPGATGLASHGWTDSQADRFAEMCRHAGFAHADVSTHRAGRRDVFAVVARLTG